MVVIGIAATMMGLAVGVFGSGADAQLKKESTHLLATMRFLYNRSVTTRRTYRLVFDLTDQKYWAEESDSSVTLSVSDEKSPAKSRPEKSDSEDSGDEEKAAAEGEPAPPKAAFNLVEEDVLKRRTFPREVKYKDYFVTHEPLGQTEGQAYLYFFPRGLTEHAIIHLTDEDEKRDYSIEVNALTGRARILAEYIDWQEAP